MNGRTEAEILKDLIDAVIEYKACIEEEYGFLAENHDPDLWDAGTRDTFDTLAGATVNATEEMKRLIVEATGDTYFTF